MRNPFRIITRPRWLERELDELRERDDEIGDRLGEAIHETEEAEERLALVEARLGIVTRGGRAA